MLCANIKNMSKPHFTHFIAAKESCTISNCCFLFYAHRTAPPLRQPLSRTVPRSLSLQCSIPHTACGSTVHWGLKRSPLSTPLRCTVLKINTTLHDFIALCILKQLAINVSLHSIQFNSALNSYEHYNRTTTVKLTLVELSDR